MRLCGFSTGPFKQRWLPVSDSIVWDHPALLLKESRAAHLSKRVALLDFKFSAFFVGLQSVLETPRLILCLDFAIILLLKLFPNSVQNLHSYQKTQLI